MMAEILKNFRDGTPFLNKCYHKLLERGSFKREQPHSSSHKHKTCTTLTSPLNSILN